MIVEAIESLVRRKDLDRATMERVFDEMLAGEATEAQIGAFLTALRMKGETVAEIAAAARAMRRKGLTIAPKVTGPLLDTAGTGGDGLHTFNISTAAAIVVAATGVAVAKHGNRAATSKAGSADVLEALGVRIDATPSAVRDSIEQIGIGFMFAPTHHGAARYAAPVRKQLGGRTIFNVLGPLANPAGATHQVVGVYREAPLEHLAEALGELGVERAWVVRGDDGLDEVSPTGRTQVAKLDPTGVTSATVHPHDFGLDPVSIDSLVGGDAEENAGIVRAVLAGEEGPRRTAVIINAAAALCVAETVESPREGAERAAEAIDSGAAAARLERWAEFTQRQ